MHCIPNHSNIAICRNFLRWLPLQSLTAGSRRVGLFSKYCMLPLSFSILLISWTIAPLSPNLLSVMSFRVNLVNNRWSMMNEMRQKPRWDHQRRLRLILFFRSSLILFSFPISSCLSIRKDTKLNRGEFRKDLYKSWKLTVNNSLISDRILFSQRNWWLKNSFL